MRTVSDIVGSRCWSRFWFGKEDAATDRLEQMTGRLFRAAQYRLTLDAFPDGDDPIICPRPPLRDVVSLDYVATDGTLTSYTGFQQDTDSIPGRVFPAIDDVWPSTREQPAAVTMVFDCGYASAADVPETVKHALKLFCELEYDDLSPAKAARVEARIAALVRGLSVRASALAGVGQ